MMEYKVEIIYDRIIRLRGLINEDIQIPSPKYAKYLKDRVGDILIKGKDFEIEWFHEDYGYAVPFGSAYKT